MQSNNTWLSNSDLTMNVQGAVCRLGFDRERLSHFLGDTMNQPTKFQQNRACVAELLPIQRVFRPDFQGQNRSPFSQRC